MADIIDRLGVEFFSKVDPAFGENLKKAVGEFNAKIQPTLGEISRTFKSLSIYVGAFYRALGEIPVMNLAKVIDPTNLISSTQKATDSIREFRRNAIGEVRGMTSAVETELNKASKEFQKYSEYVKRLSNMEDVVVGYEKVWAGKSKRGGKPAFVPIFEVGEEQMRKEGHGFSSQQEAEMSYSASASKYAEMQRAAYEKMVQLVGQLGAFERARLAAGEMIAQKLEKEMLIRERIVEFEKIIDTFRQRGIIAPDMENYIKDAKEYLANMVRGGASQEEIFSQIDTYIQKIVGGEENLKKVTMEVLGINERMVASEKELLAVAQQVAEQYAKAKQASMAGPVMAGGGAGAGGAAEWQRLIGLIEGAKQAISSFQAKLQQINLRAFIKTDELERIKSMGAVMNSEIDSLIKQLAVIGSHSGASELAKKFDSAKKEITELAKAAKGGELTDLDAKVQKLTVDLRELGVVANKAQLDAIRGGAMGGLNTQIAGMTGGVDLTYKNVKRLGLGLLELGNLQDLLKNKLALTRQEFDLMGGKSTPELNARFKETAEALGVVNHHMGVLQRGTSDASRAADRWGAGFKDMLKSQAAWLLGGALIFGTIFKIQQAFTDAVSTILKFGQAIVDVGAITSASAEDMKILEKAARDVALSSRMGFMEAAEALKILGQAGLTAKQSAEALKVVAMMVTATGASAQESVKVLTTAINVWNFSAKESTRVGNVLAAALNFSKLEINDLATSFNYLASTASQVGMSLEETAATVAVLSNAGIRASTIGTGLRGIIGQLIAPSKAFRDQLSAIGLDFEEIRMPGHNLIDVLGKLEKAGFDLTSSFEGLEKRQAGVFAAMQTMGKDAFERMTAALTGTNALLVMNERAMEGPVARLEIFKKKLMDMALSTSGIVIPSLEMLLKFLNTMIQTFKDVVPIMGFIAAVEILRVSFANAGLAAEYLGKTLTWLRAHPILMWMTILAAAVTAVRLAYDALKDSSEGRIKQIDREVSLYLQEVQQLEVLRGMLNNTNTTHRQLKDTVEALGSQYDSLKEIVNQVGFSHDALKDKVLSAINEWYEKIDTLKLDRMKIMIDDLAKLNAEADKLVAKSQRAKLAGASQLPGEAGAFGALANFGGMAKGFDRQATEVREKALEVEKGILDLARSYKGLSDEAIRAKLATAGYNAEQIKVAMAQRIIGQQIDKDAADSAAAKGVAARLTAMRTAIFEMRKELADEEGKLALQYKERMDKFPMEGGLPEGGDAYKKALEGRAAVEGWYQRERTKMVESERKRLQDIQYKFDQDELHVRKLTLDAELAYIQLYTAGEEKIIRESQVQIKLLRLKGEGEVLKTVHDAFNLGADKEGVGLRMLKTLPQMRQAFVDEENKIVAKENVDIAKIHAAALKERFTLEKEGDAQIRALRNETTKAFIALEQTKGNDVIAQQAITDERLEAENRRFLDELFTNKEKYMVDAETLDEKGSEIATEILKRHNMEVATITAQGEKAMTEAREKGIQKGIQKEQRTMQGRIDESTRDQALSLRELEKQYDELSETVRNSDFGQKLKNEISKLTVEVYQKHRDEFQRLADLVGKQFPKDSDLAKSKIAELMEAVERYNARVREARKFMADYAATHSQMWNGMVMGFRDFSTKLANEYEIGKQLAESFGNAVYKGIADPMEDLFTNKLKTFTDYWRSFTTNLNQMFAKAVTQMIFQWIGLREAMSGVGAGGTGFNWGALFGGLFGGGSTNPPVTEIPGGAHQGGYIQDLLDRIPKMHSGGTAPLTRDEVLVKMLKTEGVLNPRAMRTMGKEELNYRNATGQVPGGLTINAPIHLAAGDALSKADRSFIRSEVEVGIRRAVREYA